MDWTLLNDTEINTGTVIIRLFLSTLLGGLLGWEREPPTACRPPHAHGHLGRFVPVNADLHLYTPDFSEYQNVDPGRIAAQVVSGIGFLGAGAIFRLGGSTHGLTTAATIWAVAAVGLSVGVGMYTAAIVVTLLLLFVLAILYRVGKKYFNGGSLKTLKVSFQSTKLETSKLLGILEKYDIITKNINVVQSKNKQNSMIKLYVFVPEGLHVKHLYKELNELKNVGQISLGQDF